MALSLDLIGGSSYVWSAKHLAHHSYTNVTDHDPDIDSLPLARFDPAQDRRPWHRYQHIYIWALYRWSRALAVHVGLLVPREGPRRPDAAAPARGSALGR